MQEIRCHKCGKLLLEIEVEGKATVKKICPKCKTVNNYDVVNPQLTDEEIKEFKKQYDRATTGSIPRLGLRKVDGLF